MWNGSVFFSYSGQRFAAAGSGYSRGPLDLGPGNRDIRALCGLAYKGG